MKEAVGLTGIMKNPTTMKVIGGPKCAIYSTIELKKSRSMLSSEIRTPKKKAVPSRQLEKRRGKPMS